MAKEQKYIVVFQDDAGNVLKTSFASKGETIEGPKLPEVKEELKHHRIVFSGWDTSLENVQSNLVVKSIYQKVPKLYLVMYLSEEGKMVSMEKVPYGEAAKQAFIPQKEDTPEYHYVFKGWSQDLSKVESDKMVKPIFARRRKRYLVIFCDEQKRIISKESVAYGELPQIPENVIKAEDETFTYHFKGWSEEVKPVSGRVVYQAVFSSVYKEYSLSVFNEGEKILEEIHHYGDEIILPQIYKKGYTLSWRNYKTKIQGNTEIFAEWEFTNKKGKICTTDSGVWRILNPSIHHGTISCVSYQNKKAVERMPEKIKLGDYYYKIVRMEKNALKSCKGMKNLTLPDCLEEVMEQGLGGCSTLQILSLGKNVQKLDSYLCKGDKCLKEVKFGGNKLRKISPKVFDGISGKIKVSGKGLQPFQLKRMFHQSVISGKIIIS